MARFMKRYHPPGTPPGTLVRRRPPKPIPLQIGIVDYGADHFEEIANATAKQCEACLSRPTTTWVHVHGHIEPDLLRELGTLFNLHPLALEDVLNTGQRPKVETYNNQYFVVASLPLLTKQGLHTEQVSLFMGKNYVISFHDGAVDPFNPVRERFRGASGHIRQRKADYLLYTLLDLVIDQGFPVLEALGERIEEVEEALLGSPGKEALTEMHNIKRELLLLRRMLWPQRELLNGLMREDHDLILDTTTPYLRDCYDHTIQIMDLIETYRDMTASMVDVYLSSVSNRLNEVMRVLTVIATVFIPPTFVVGVYGMNFDRTVSGWNMPELGWPFGYLFVWSVIALMIAGMLLYFKRKKWF